MRNLQTQIAPRLFESSSQRRLLDGDPAWSHQLLLDDEVLKHTRVCAKHMGEGLSLQILRQWRELSRVSDFKELALAILHRQLKCIFLLDHSRPEILDSLE